MTAKRLPNHTSKVTLREFIELKLDALIASNEGHWREHDKVHEVILARLASVNEWRTALTAITGTLVTRTELAEAIQALGKRLSDLETIRIRESGATDERLRASADAAKSNEERSQRLERWVQLIGLAGGIVAAIFYLLPR